MRIHHQEVELLLSLFLMDRGEQHAVGLDSHHGSRWEVGDGDQCLSDELFGLIEGVDTAQDYALLVCSVVQDELQELLALRHCLALQNLNGTEIGLAEGLKINRICKERLDLYLGEVRLFRRNQRSAFDDRSCSSFRSLCGLNGTVSLLPVFWLFIVGITTRFSSDHFIIMRY